MTANPPPPSPALDRLFDVLADDTRRRAVEQLSVGPQRAGALARATSVSAPVMSRHLRILLEAGLVAADRSPADARVRVFRLRPDAMVPLQAWLDQLGAHWEEQLASFKHHVETKGRS